MTQVALNGLSAVCRKDRLKTPYSHFLLLKSQGGPIQARVTGFLPGKMKVLRFT